MSFFKTGQLITGRSPVVSSYDIARGIEPDGRIYLIVKVKPHHADVKAVPSYFAYTPLLEEEIVYMDMENNFAEKYYKVLSDDWQVQV